MKGADYIPIGAAVRLVSVSSLARELGVSLQRVKLILLGLRVPVFSPSGPSEEVEYFNLPSLETTLFALLRPGGKNWTMGSMPAEVLRLLDDPQASIWKERNIIARCYGRMDRYALRDRVSRLADHLKKVGKCIP